MKSIHFWAWVFAAICFSPAAFADDSCQLKLATSLDMAISPTGGVIVPMTVNGAKLTVVVDTGGIASMLSEAKVKALGLREKKMSRMRMVMFGGTPIDKYVQPDDVTLGSLHTSALKFTVMPDGALPDGVDGTLAPDIMRNYDMDFDFASGKLHMISQDHCPGEVVYWTHDPAAVVPITVSSWGQISLHVQIDGKDFPAMLDTGSDRSTMSLEAAEDAFGFDAHSPDLKSIAQIDYENGKEYTYPFKALTFGGVQVNNPYIVLVPNKEIAMGRAPRLLIGMGILRQLRLYIAYGEQKIYLTPATAH